MPVAKLKLSFSQVTRSVTLKNKNKYAHASGCRLPQLRINGERQTLLTAPPQRGTKAQNRTGWRPEVSLSVSISINQYFRTLNRSEIWFSKERNKLSFIVAKQRYPRLITLSLQLRYFHLRRRQFSNGTSNE